MHKRIVEQIKHIVEECVFKDSFDVYIKSQTTDGFWKMIIISDDKIKGYLSHIEQMARAIGILYGEGLATSRQGCILKIS